MIKNKEWIDVTNRLPNGDITRYLVYTDSKKQSIAFYYKDEWHFSDRHGTYTEWGYKVTHWMPLPKPPK